MSNYVVSISREFGSGGRLIGKKLAASLGIPCYDRTLIQKTAEKSGLSPDFIARAEERARSRFHLNIAPIGIFCYVSSMVASVGMSVLVPLAKYFLVMAFGMVIMFVAYLFVCGAYCKVNPLKLGAKMGRMLVTAFTTISSAVTLPTAMEDAKKKIGIREDVCDVLLPLGVPLNSNGVAIHMTVDALCIAQLYGITFGPSDFLTCWLICTMISFVNAATPGASLVSLTMMIPALGLPMEAIGIFGGLEYPTGATRTPLNVTGDVFAAMLVAGPDGIDHDIFDGKKEFQEAA